MNASWAAPAPCRRAVAQGAGVKLAGAQSRTVRSSLPTVNRAVFVAIEWSFFTIILRSYPYHILLLGSERDGDVQMDLWKYFLL